MRQSIPIGNRLLNCTNCNLQQPTINSQMKRDRGCRRYGMQYTSVSPHKIDHTGIDELDHIDFCPASVYDPVYAGWVYEALKIKNVHGGLEATSNKKINHMVERVVSFYEDCVMADSRFDAQVLDAERSLFEA